MMVEMELVIHGIFAGYISDPISTLLVSKSILNLVNLRKLSPRITRCANDDTMIAGVGNILRSEAIST